MSNNTAITVTRSMQDEIAQAEWFAKSDLMPKHINSPQKVFAITTLGRELGLGPWAAINNIYIAGGKPTINAALMLALIQRSNLLEKFEVEVSEAEAVVTMARRGVGTYTARFSMADADRAGLTSGFNSHSWKKYPKAMLKARALSDVARTLFADVILNLYTPEELDAPVEVTADGEIRVLPNFAEEQAVNGWTKANLRELQDYAEGKGLTKHDVLRILEVERASLYTAGPDEAKKAIEAHLAAARANTEADEAYAAAVGKPEPEVVTPEEEAE
jgi:hypothetical protein